MAMDAWRAHLRNVANEWAAITRSAQGIYVQGYLRQLGFPYLFDSEHSARRGSWRACIVGWSPLCLNEAK